LANKIYLVGGIEGKAFPTYDLAYAYAKTTKTKSIVREIDFIDDVKPVEEIKGCILHFDYNGNYDVKHNKFNNLDNLPRIQLMQGYGKYRYRILLPIPKNSLTKEMISQITTFSIPYLKDKYIWWNNKEKEYKNYISIIENIIKGCDDSYIAKIILSFS